MNTLSLAERGAYNSVIDLLYSRDGDVPDDDVFIARAISCHVRQWRTVKASLTAAGKIWSEGGKLCAKQVKETIDEANKVSDTQRSIANKRWMNSNKGNENNDAVMPPGIASRIKSQESRKTPSLRSGVIAREARSGDDRPVNGNGGGQKNAATRIDPGWMPTPLDRQTAMDEGLTEAEITRIADSFRDYWLSKPGAQARKLDWSATWRNWVRREADNREKSRNGNGPRNGNGHGRPSRNGYVDLLMELQEDERAGNARPGAAVPGSRIPENGHRADDRSGSWWEGDFAPSPNAR